MTEQIKKKLIDKSIQFQEAGLGIGTAGNLSVRSGIGFIITPSNIAYLDLTPESLVYCDMAGNVIDGTEPPSSEWAMHAGIYQHREKVNAIVHSHSPYATGIACTRQPIPAFHYMIAITGGMEIPCADYATFGTEKLASNVLSVLTGNQRACLLANHGTIAVDENLDLAFQLACEVEYLAGQYWIAKQTGMLTILEKAEMARVLEKFKDYGSRQSHPKK